MTAINQILVRDGTGELVEVRTIPPGSALDSTGVYIQPANMPITEVTRDVNGNVLTTKISDGTYNWVQTITRDVNGYIATKSIWVRL